MRRVLGSVLTTDAAAPSRSLGSGLEAATDWSISAGQLALYDKQGRQVLLLHAPTVEGAWTVTELPALDPTIALADHPVTLTFAGGTVSGNTGCNDASGPYSIRNESILIGPSPPR